jgi:hypothetical protein
MCGHELGCQSLVPVQYGESAVRLGLMVDNRTGLHVCGQPLELRPPGGKKTWLSGGLCAFNLEVSMSADGCTVTRWCF